MFVNMDKYLRWQNSVFHHFDCYLSTIPMGMQIVNATPKKPPFPKGGAAKRRRVAARGNLNQSRIVIAKPIHGLWQSQLYSHPYYLVYFV